MAIYPIGTKNDDETRNIINNNFEELKNSFSNYIEKVDVNLLENLSQKSEKMLSELYNTLENPPVVPGVTPNIPVTVPKGFSWTTDNPIINRIFTDGNGHFSTTLTASSYKVTGGKTYYVDWNNGNTTNDGLSASTPVKHFVHIWDKLMDGDTVIIAEGRYYRYGGYIFKTSTKSINIIGNGNVDICMADEPTWSKLQTIQMYTILQEVL